MSSAAASNSSRSDDGSELASTGIPAAFAAFFDSILSPIASMAPGFGPMKTMPAASSARGNASRSDRKP